jgi:D-serine deaminase-like pyridoxal phosphate-dependent protein
VHLRDLPTPCVLVDRTRVERNVERMQAAANSRGVRLRPHAKTHKSVAFARLQIERGAAGVCCAKIGEAEVFADAGIEDIRIPYPLNPINAPRLLALLNHARLSFIVDHIEVARGWSEAMQAAGREVDVLVKVDVGFHRCGIDPVGPGAVEFVTAIANMKGLRFRGLLSHAGHGYGAMSDDEAAGVARAEAGMLNGLAGCVRGAGVPVEEISVGATPTVRFSIREEGITEVRPGNYIYYDRTQVALGAASWRDCALTVLARIVTTHAPDRLIFDSGSKTLTNDLARGATNPVGFGAVLSSLDGDEPDDTLVIERLSEEHATVRASRPARLKPGDLVRIVPNHSCVVSNLVDRVWIVDGQHVIEPMDVSARGRIT